MYKISFADPPINSRDINFIKSAINSKWIGLGQYNQKLENKFKKICNKKFSLTISSGTSGAWLALNAINIQNKQGEILVPAICYASPLNMLKNINPKKIKITPVDIDSTNFQLCLEDVKQKLNKNILAIIVVHNYGNTANILKIKKIIKQKKLKTKIIEDFSEAIFTKYEGNKYTGFYGDISFCSLHATKTITSGEGGVILCNNKKIYKNIKQASRNGMKLNNVPYQYDLPGFNFKMSNILASLGYSQILNKDQIIAKRRAITDRYNNIFKKFNWIQTIKIRKEEKPVMWVYPVAIKSKKLKISLFKYLKQNKIEARFSFSSVWNLKYLNIKKNQIYLKNDQLSEKILMIPNHSNINSSTLNYLNQKLILFDKKFIK
jgi:perosamine synthetase